MLDSWIGKFFLTKSRPPEDQRTGTATRRFDTCNNDDDTSEASGLNTSSKLVPCFFCWPKVELWTVYLDEDKQNHFCRTRTLVNKRFLVKWSWELRLKMYRENGVSGYKTVTFSNQKIERLKATFLGIK